MELPIEQQSATDVVQLVIFFFYRVFGCQTNVRSSLVSGSRVDLPDRPGRADAVEKVFLRGAISNIDSRARVDAQ
jgi:hypothetical protein